MGVSDHIAQFINALILRKDGVAELSRGELAELFDCVPSQINYVISTRFTPEHGYLVESRRGGGGYIRITRVRLDRRGLIMHTINAVGDTVDARSAQALVSNLKGAQALSDEQLKLIAGAVGDRALKAAPPDLRDAVRAAILKECLLISL